VTLFQNEKIYSTGAVGIALTDSSRRPVPRMEYPGLKALTEPLTVTRSEGNMINELNNRNPAQLLLAAMRENGLGSFKDDLFYLGALRQNQLHEIYHITSGDPSRGTISLESDAAPIVGTQVQLYHRVKTTSSDARDYLLSNPGRVLSFTNPADHAAVLPDSAEETRILRGHFLAASENGMIISRSVDGEAEVAWTCVVQGAIASLTWM